MADRTFGDVMINGTLGVAGDKNNPTNVALEVTPNKVQVTGDIEASGGITTNSGTVTASQVTGNLVYANSVSIAGVADIWYDGVHLCMTPVGADSGVYAYLQANGEWNHT